MTGTEHQIPPLRDLPPGRGDARRQHLLAEIADEATPRLSLPWFALPRFRAAAVAGFGAIVVVVAAIPLFATQAGTGTASAAEIQTKISAAMSAPRNIRGEFAVQTRPLGPAPHRQTGCHNCLPVVPTPSRFAIGSDGSYSLITLPLDASPRSDSAYNASTGVQTLFLEGAIRGLRVYVTATNLDPSQGAHSPEAELAAWVQHALAAGSPHVKNTSFDGRSAWRLTLRFTPGDDFYDTYGVRVDVTIDKATGLVLQVTQYAYSPDRWTSIESIHNLQVDPPTTAADFTVPKPAGVRTVSHDFGFHRVPVEQASAILGYQPLLPTKTGGRAIVDFAVAATSSQKLLPEMVGAPVFQDVASIRYGRGLNGFTLSTRRGVRSDIALAGSGRTLTLSDGALAGETAWLSTSPPDPGYLAAYHDGLVVEIRAFSTHDALMVANSLAKAK